MERIALKRFGGWPWLLLVGAVVGLVLVIGLILAGPAVGRILESNLDYPQECSYRLTVVTYEDRDGDGVRDEGEPGLAGVPVRVQVGSKAPQVVETDADGLASVERYADICASLEDGVAVEMEPPSGYVATTSLHFGPFPVTAYPSEPPLQVVYVGFQER
jgi:hypothetical protein